MAVNSQGKSDGLKSEDQRDLWLLRSFLIAVILTVFLLSVSVYAFLEAQRAYQDCCLFHENLSRAQEQLLRLEEDVNELTRRFVETSDPAHLRQRQSHLSHFNAFLLATQRLAQTAVPEVGSNLVAAARPWEGYQEQAIALAQQGETTAACEQLHGQGMPKARARFRALCAQLTEETGPLHTAVALRYHAAAGRAGLAVGGVVALLTLTWATFFVKLRRWHQTLLHIIEDRTRVAEALRASEERYNLALAGANDGIWDWNLQTDRCFFSPRWKWLLGYEDHEIGTSPAEWFSRVHSEDRPRLMAAIRDHLDGKTQFLDEEIRMVTRQGQWRWMHVRGLAFLSHDGSPVRMAGSLTDITRRKIAEEQLREGAFRDPLTELPNRAFFIPLLERAVARVRRHPDQWFALLFVDLDGFKNVNDRLGHSAGDHVLYVVAQRLTRSLRPTDIVTRYGGDEFVVLTEDIETPQHVYELANRIERTISEPINVADTTVSIGASVGIAFSTELVEDYLELIVLADRRMYEVKSQRKKS